ncbi:MAG: alpha/beta fold hydrolase [Bacteroidales bacterium]|nr:alpha/beta fold hydrolase [Bacteroidales bacterium]
MKKTILLLLLLSVLSLSAQQSQVPWSWQNRWWNTFLEQSMLPLYLTFQPNVDIEEGGQASISLTPLLISPLQSSQPIVPTHWSFLNDTLRFVHSQLGLRITLRLNPADTSFTGSFRQGMMSSQQHFACADSLNTYPRPQTPTEPYNFVEEEVTVTRRDAQGREVTLSGTLTLPKPQLGDTKSHKRQYPAVLLVSGSGQQNRDEELFKHKPFLVIADYLASQGIAVLRYDDRGVGLSRGDLSEATTFDFADDAEALFQYLRHHPRIDRQRVSIMGHSEGGAIAAIVASRNRHVHSIVMLAGPSCTGRDVLLQQNQSLFLAAGVDSSLVAIRIATMSEIFDSALTVSPDRYREVFNPIVERRTATLSDDERRAIGFDRGTLFALAQQLSMPWMHCFLTTDPLLYLQRVHCPITAFYNERDLQVLAAPHVARLQEALLQSNRRSNPQSINIIITPQLNHLFQHCQEGTTREYLELEETFAPEVLQQLPQALFGVNNQ